MVEKIKARDEKIKPDVTRRRNYFYTKSSWRYLYLLKISIHLTVLAR